MLYAIAGGTLTIAEVQSSFPTTRTLPQQQESSMPLFAPVRRHRFRLSGTPANRSPFFRRPWREQIPLRPMPPMPARRALPPLAVAPVGDSLGTDNLDVLDADEAEDRAKERLLKVVGLLRRSRRIKAAA